MKKEDRFCVKYPFIYRLALIIFISFIASFISYKVSNHKTDKQFKQINHHLFKLELRAYELELLRQRNITDRKYNEVENDKDK